MTKIMYNRLAECGCIYDKAIGVSFDALITSVIDLDFIIRMDSILELYMMKYRFHTSKKHFPPIESLPTDEKRHFWDEAKKYTDEHSRRIKAAKVIYTINILCTSGDECIGAD